MRPNSLKRKLDAGQTVVGSFVYVPSAKLTEIVGLSVDDSRGGGFTLHHRFLGAGCVIVEGLALAGVEAGTFDLSATPLRLTGAEASPIRALLRPPSP